MALSIFTPSVSGMEAQSHAMGTVSTNLANMRTTGYKASETMFYTLLGSSPVVKGDASSGLGSSRVDIDGVGFYDRTNISRQGQVTPTGNRFDAAINGENAFFVLKDPSGKDFYTRAGNFSTQTEGGKTYMVGNNGFRLQGFPAVDGGGFSGNLEDIELKYQEKVPSRPTTTAEVTANVPATGVDTSSYGITVYGPNNDGKPMNMLFTKVEGKVNTWDISFTVEDGTVVGGGEAVFDSSGNLITPKNLDVAVNWADGSSNNINLDISKMTQLAGSSGTTNVSQDGAPSGNFLRSYIDTDGVVKAIYSNGDTLNYAKIALVGFTSPDSLTPINGTLFEANGETGNSYYVMGPDTENKNIIVPEAVEASNVNVEKEFSSLIIIQRAYTINSNAFTTANEMTTVAINLKT